MIIAQISDTHIALNTPDAVQRRRDFELVIADINGLDPIPDVIVHTGDVVHNGDPDEYPPIALRWFSSSSRIGLTRWIKN